MAVYKMIDLDLSCEYIARAAQANAISELEFEKNGALSAIDDLPFLIPVHEDGQFIISPNEATHLCLLAAQEIIKSGIDSIVEEMVNELSIIYKKDAAANTKNLSWSLSNEVD